jgi:hypothetical protein
MSIELKAEERKPSPGFTLELTAETYEELSGGLQGIRTVTGAITGMIPSHLAERLETCLARSLGAIGMIKVVREDPEPTPEERKLELEERRYDERVQEGGAK